MKKVIFLMIIILLGTLYLNIDNTKEEKNDNKIVKAVFISYIDYSSLKGKEVSIQKDIINEMINNIYEYGFNSIILQVRAFSDSIYDSAYFPLSKVVSYEDGKMFDILSYFINICNDKDIDVYAWVNPYRISNTSDVDNISKDSIYYKWINTNKIGIYDNGIYFNPSDEEVKDLIVNGVSEIASNYSVKAILFDDYFYPNDIIDLDNYNNYDGDLSINEYRISNVNDLLSRCYNKIKEVNNNIEFGISPSGNISNNLNIYLDIESILKDNYLDFIMPQLYYGFLNENMPYIKTLNKWSNLNINNIDLYVGLSIYKSGKIDNYAGSGMYEWIDNSDIIKRQVESSKNIPNYKGFGVFRYEYLFNKKDNTLLEEVNNLSKVIKDY